MTGAQASYLKTLSEECGELEAFAPDLTKAEASKRIDAVRANAVPDGTGNRDEPRFWEAEDKLEDFPDRRSPRIATPGSDHKQRCAGRPQMREVYYWRRASAEVVRRPPEVDTASFGATVKLWPRTNLSDRRRG